MTMIHVEDSAIIPASPERVYEVLRDYENHHVHILPQQFFSDFRIESGGVGEGTVGWVRVHARGQVRPLHFRVSEPEPGSRMVESDLENGIETSFSLSPEGSGTHLTISSEWESRGGLGGLIDRLFSPGVLRQIFASELHQLKVYLGKLEDSWVVQPKSGE